jgi:putative phage-type endonuclease
MSDGKATAQSFDPQERRRYLGASEIAAVMGLDKWRTPLDVFQEKTGISQPFAGNKHTERGNRLEAIAAEMFTEITGRKLMRKTSGLEHPDYPFIRGHIDRIIVGEQAIAEIKCPSIAAYRKYQREGLPESMVIQMQIYLGLTGYKSGTWLIFCADAWDLATFEIEFDQAIYDAAVKAAVEFWKNTANGIAPTPSTEEKGELKLQIERIAAQGNEGGLVVYRDDETFTARAQALSEAISLKRDAEELFEIAKKDILDAVENECGIYEGGGLRVYYTESAGRKTLDKKAVAAAGIDLSPFEKQGSPFKTFKTYQITGEQK